MREEQPQPRTPKALGGTVSGVKWTQIFADNSLVTYSLHTSIRGLSRRLVLYSPASAGRRRKALRRRIHLRFLFCAFSRLFLFAALREIFFVFCLHVHSRAFAVVIRVHSRS
jgi:hypothetical protein